MPLLQLNLNPSQKELRYFAGLWFPAFWGVVGYLVFRRHVAVVPFVIWSCAAAQTLVGLALPATIRPAFLLMMRASYPIGWVMSHVALVFVYFVFITPIGWLIRVFHDPMRRKFDSSAGSYWDAWEPVDQERYFRQM
jgi:hypothetical protein